MNIDVREYLRINPISSHDLSTSSNDNDCFLYFQDDGSYSASTQQQMFNTIVKAIFGKLVHDTDNGLKFNINESTLEWNAGIRLEKS